MKGKCAKQEVTAYILTLNSKLICGSNWCANPQIECPRKDLPSGQGYELCKDICKQKNHAEVDACINAGDEAIDGTLYLIGHTYCCENCIKIMKKYKIKKVVFENSSELILFEKEAI